MIFQLGALAFAAITVCSAAIWIRRDFLMFSIKEEFLGQLRNTGDNLQYFPLEHYENINILCRGSQAGEEIVHRFLPDWAECLPSWMSPSKKLALKERLIASKEVEYIRRLVVLHANRGSYKERRTSKTLEEDYFKRNPPE